MSLFLVEHGTPGFRITRKLEKLGYKVGDVKIVGHLNVPGRIAASASALYARNLYAFVETLIDKDKKEVAVDWDDQLVSATNLTRDGAVVHPAFADKGAA